MKNVLMLVLVMIMSLAMIDLNAKEIILTADNTVSLGEVFTEGSVGKLMEDVAALDSALPSGYPIYLFLNTPGGSIQAGLEFFEFAKGLNRPIHTITLFAASMGFQTVQSLGKRYILGYGVLMSHKARGGFEGEFGGTLSQLDSRYTMWLRRVDMLDKLTVSRSGGKQTLDSYRKAYDNELWLNGKEAVDQGYADEVVTVKCDKTLSGTTKDSSKSVFGGLIEIKTKSSGCPIRTGVTVSGEDILTSGGKMSLETFIAKGGVFGESCNPSYNLCLPDKAITLQSINEEKQKILKEVSDRNSKSKAIYSY